MRVFIAVLFLIFSFQSVTKAEDIRDFEIEGISIGDSLLDYFSEELIKNDEKLSSAYNSRDFFIAEFKSNLKKNYNPSSIYDEFRFHLKRDDNTYKIFHVAGNIIYENMDLKKCIKKKDEISNELIEIFGSDKMQEGKIKNHVYDKTGNSKTISTYFNLNEGRIRIVCNNWSEALTKKHGWNDYLSIAIYSNEFLKWLRTKAYAN